MRVGRGCVLSLLLLLSLVGGCSVPSVPELDGGVITRALTDEPATLDPQGPANSGLNVVLPYLFDTLVVRRMDGGFDGLLAERWQVAPDGRSVDVNLRGGVKFHDGSPLDAAAVVFTFERFKQKGDKSPIAGNVKEMNSVTALDSSTVRFTLDKPNAAFLATLAMPYAAILSPSAVAAAGEAIGRQPVGTGPFKFGEWLPGVSISLVRNPAYNWGPPEVENRGAVRFGKLVFLLIPDPSTQLAALQAGDIDVLFANDPSQLAKLANDRGVHLEKISLDALVYLGYNCAKPPPRRGESAAGAVLRRGQEPDRADGARGDGVGGRHTAHAHDVGLQRGLASLRPGLRSSQGQVLAGRGRFRPPGRCHLAAQRAEVGTQAADLNQSAQ